MCEEELQGLVKVMVLPRTSLSLDTHAFGSARDFAQICQQRVFFFIYLFLHLVGKPLIH